MSKTFTTPAVVEAVLTHALTGVRDPHTVASELQACLCSLVKQGYEILGVTALPTALLCSAVRRGVTPMRVYGCEGLTCDYGRHTLNCPHIDE